MGDSAEARDHRNGQEEARTPDNPQQRVTSRERPFIPA